MTDGGEVAPMRDNVKSAGITICFFYLLVHSSLRFLLHCISWWKNRLKGSDREISQCYQEEIPFYSSIFRGPHNYAIFTQCRVKIYSMSSIEVGQKAHQHAQLVCSWEVRRVMKLTLSRDTYPSFSI